MDQSVYILAAARTAQGAFLGSLSTVPAPKLGATAIKAAVSRAGVDANRVDKVYMGNVIQAGVGQAPARQAAIFAGLAESVRCSTVNKVCGSGLESIILGAQSIQTQDAELVVSGGMENMSLAPHLLSNSRFGYKFGETALKDSMQWDGLWDVYTDRAMGNCAEECVKKYNFTREEQDQFAIESFKGAQKASQAGVFKSEIEAVVQNVRGKEIVIDTDEGPFKADFTKIPQLRPAFDKNGTITAANASTINDGACALVLAGEAYKAQAKFKIIAAAGHAQNPTWFTTAPVESTKKVLKKAGMNLADIDLFEINEAFAAVTMAAIRELELPSDRVNIYGGAISLGHPIGVSGARIVQALMSGLEREAKKYGLASICIGGGEALSLIIERI